VQYLVPGLTSLPDILLLPSAVGELWMVGHLLIKGTALGVDGKLGTAVR
jgi:hypothetical protein